MGWVWVDLAPVELTPGLVANGPFINGIGCLALGLRMSCLGAGNLWSSDIPAVPLVAVGRPKTELLLGRALIAASYAADKINDGFYSRHTYKPAGQA